MSSNEPSIGQASEGKPVTEDLGTQKPHVNKNTGRSSTEVSKHKRTQSTASTIQDSPLKQVNLGENSSEKPKLKVVSIYESLFTNDKPHPPGFWIEFFLLQVNSEELRRVLAEAQPLSNHPDTVQTIFLGAIANLGRGKGDQPPRAVIKNALLILEAVIGAVVKPTEALHSREVSPVDTAFDTALTTTGSATTSASKKPPSGKGKSKKSSSKNKNKSTRSATKKPSVKASSGPVIPPSALQTLAGLDRASAVLDELTSNVLYLLNYTRDAVTVEYAVDFMFHTSKLLLGTQLSGLFTTKNFFAALLNVVDIFTDSDMAYTALETIGILTALNVYDDDGVPVYQQRISDYVDDTVMMKMIALFQRTFTLEPVSKQQGWFGWLRAQPATNELASSAAKLSSSESATFLLPLFFFVLHNPIFCNHFASSPALVTVMEYFGPQFSKSSKYELEHAHSWLGVVLLRQLVDSEFTQLVDPASAACIKIDAPKLDLDTSRRMRLAGIMDLSQVGLRAGIVSVKSGTSRLPTDWELLDQFTGLLYQCCAQLAQSRTMWPSYSWTGLFKFILGLVRYIATNFESVTNNTFIVPIVTKLLNVVIGISLNRDMLDEEDWTYILFSIVKMPQLFADISRLANLEHIPAISAARAMIAQYELNKEKPELSTIVKQGRYAAGVSLLDPLRPLSTQHPMLKKSVLAKINASEN